MPASCRCLRRAATSSACPARIRNGSRPPTASSPASAPGSPASSSPSCRSSRSCAIRSARTRRLPCRTTRHSAAPAAQALGDGGDIGSGLFRIRAATLLQDLKPDDAAATLSGLLIGAEIASARRVFGASGGKVILVASGPLGLLYSAALKLAGSAVLQADADEAVRAGLFEAAKRLGWVERAAA